MYKERADNVLSPVLGRFHELDISHGKGVYLYDHQDNAYLDFGSGIAVTATGHCHPAVVEAIQKQAETLIHPCIATGNYASLVDCAEKLTGLLGPEHYSVFFDQSGTGAVEAAIKLAKYVTKRHKVISFKGGFHGRTMGSLALTTSKESYRQGYGPMLEGAQFFPFPYCYRCPWGQEKDSCGEKTCTEALLDSALFGDDIAAVIIEPILGEGGYIPAPKAFLQALEKRCQEHGILLILDEIQTGIGRTGPWFSFQDADIQPDIVVSAKGLGSGMPIAACLAKKAIMDQWSKGAHGGTYGGNPVTCAAAAATIDVVSKLRPQIETLSKIAESFLRDRLSDHPNIGDIRVKGLMIGIECVTDKESKEPYPDMVVTLLSRCLEKQLIIIMCGIHSNVIRLAPPLIISEEELLNGLSILCDCIHDYH